MKHTILYSQMTYEELSELFLSKNYTLITPKENYINLSQKVEYLCQKHFDKGIQRITGSKLKSGQGCYYCGRERTIQARTKPFDYENLKALCDSRNFDFIDAVRENSVIYILFVCRNHPEMGIQRMRKTNMKRDIKGCKYCKGDLPESAVREKINKISPHISIVGRYKNISTPVECECEKHNVVWSISPGSLLRGTGCKKCGIEKLSKLKLTQEEYVDRLMRANPDIELLSIYNGVENSVTVKCKKCGYEWESNARSLLINGTSCRKCSYTYKGEDKVISVLQDLHIPFFQNYKFDDCTDIRPLPFDFYLPEYNACIEFDGQQHFEARFGEKNFLKTQEHDAIKNKYCEIHKIELIRIPYWESDNIKQIIKERIESIKMVC